MENMSIPVEDVAADATVMTEIVAADATARTDAVADVINK